MRTQIMFGILMLTLVGAHVGVTLADKDPRTERSWKAKCASCHGDDGKGQTEQGKKMGMGDITTAAWQKEFTDDKIKAVVNDGFKREKNGKHQEMDSFKDKLRPDQVDALVVYIRALAK
jgi:mono/diheme cytochrome c family protein